jgi:hypothetical protein
MSPENVKQQAFLLNETSLDYHLSHAVFACNKIIEGELKRYSAAKIKELKERLHAAEKNNNFEKIKEISIEIDRLKRPFRISVEYFDDENMGGGRVIRLPESNQFVISLPKNLLKQSRKQDGSYDEEGVRKLRCMMAHEIGHIALQIKELLELPGLQGTKLMSTDQEEEEAIIFAEELLRLRHERNKRLYETGEWEAF